MKSLMKNHGWWGAEGGWRKVCRGSYFEGESLKELLMASKLIEGEVAFEL
jgi:hypothetical protein